MEGQSKVKRQRQDMNLVFVSFSGLLSSRKQIPISFTLETLQKKASCLDNTIIYSSLQPCFQTIILRSSVPSSFSILAFSVRSDKILACITPSVNHLASGTTAQSSREVLDPNKTPSADTSYHQRGLETMAHLNLDAPPFVTKLNVNAAPFVPSLSSTDPFAWQLEIGRHTAPDPALEVIIDFELHVRLRHDGSVRDWTMLKRSYSPTLRTRGWDNQHVPINLPTQQR
ncbi:MAG: hypothetical protein M1828_001280 [Chrysothrix sp. TS-e1954]|nr:MAG: hypothetical protein M1828_001280 [Chrysothrix sp. TS-e1954]